MSEAIHHPNYTKVYYWLVGLLLVSVIGPMVGIRVLTLVTAFGIAVVKAYLVARNFMHINIAPRYVAYLITTALIFVLLFFSAVSPDVMKADGSNWAKSDASWNAPIEASVGSHH